MTHEPSRHELGKLDPTTPVLVKTAAAGVDVVIDILDVAARFAGLKYEREFIDAMRALQNLKEGLELLHERMFKDQMAHLNSVKKERKR